MSTSNENNNTSPPRESETGTQNLTPVIEYENAQPNRAYRPGHTRHSISQNGEKCSKRGNM